MSREPLSHDLLRDLATPRGGPCVSIYAPLDGAEAIETSRTRFENLIRDVAYRLTQNHDDEEARALVESIQAAVQEIERGIGAGIAIFADANGVRWVATPWTLPTTWHVTDRFFLKPLAPVDMPHAFVLVALSQDRVRAYRVERDTIDELDLDDLPRNGTDAIPGADAEHNGLQMHSAAVGGEAIFHGHRDDTDGEDELELRLCRQTAEAVRGALPYSGLPVVVAAVERLGAAFKRIASGLEVCAVVEGNPDALSEGELLTRARPAFDDYVEGVIRGAGEALGDAIHNGLGSTELAAIVVAAHDGRVDTLYVDRSLERWGNLDLGRREVDVHEERQPDDDELVDLAISTTLAQGGRVLPMVPETVDGDIAALFRHA